MTNNTILSFGGIEKEYSDFESSQIVLQSIPFDGTSTWGKGADKGFDAFIKASENLELYDIETDSEVYRRGIFIPEPINCPDTPEEMYELVYDTARKLLGMNKFLTFFGGEHSISIGIIKAFKQKYDDLTVLQLDAHSDLRISYLGSEYNHACALYYASQNTNLIQIGIRSMDISEKEILHKDKCYFAHDIHKSDSWMEQSISKMTENVYLTIDLDVFDPSIMPSTGTPEPGGLGWYDVVFFLSKVFQHRNVVGFDIVELAPNENNKAPDFMTAKLYYKLLSYKFLKND